MAWIDALEGSKHPGAISEKFTWTLWTSRLYFKDLETLWAFGYSKSQCQDFLHIVRLRLDCAAEAKLNEATKLNRQDPKVSKSGVSMCLWCHEAHGSIERLMFLLCFNGDENRFEDISRHGVSFCFLCFSIRISIWSPGAPGISLLEFCTWGGHGVSWLSLCHSFLHFTVSVHVSNPNLHALLFGWFWFPVLVGLVDVSWLFFGCVLRNGRDWEGTPKNEQYVFS